MRTTYTAVKPLEPGKPVDVVERDESGALVGAWHGYWNFKRGTVALYPNPKNRYVSWPNGELPKKRIVSDREVTFKNAECRMQKGTSSVAKGDRLAATRSQNGSDVINVIHDRSAASLPAGEGNCGVQQQMKFY